jgi:aminoglycoside phosphotransferase (APT) family kinase protein
MSTDLTPESILVALGYPDATVVGPVSGGADALLWRVEDGGEPYALRLLTKWQHRQAEREILLNTWVHRHGIPAPEVVASGTVEDRPAYLMRWVDGEPIGHLAMSGTADPASLERIIREFGAMQARIHVIPPPAGLEDMSDVFTHHPPGAELKSHLDAGISSERALLHFDYHPLNVMANGTGITAVLDWANARVGDRRFDLARTRAIIELVPTDSPAVRSLIDHALAWWQAGYESVAGPVTIPPLFQWFAARFMESDLAPNVGKPHVPWLNDDYLQRVRAYGDEARIETIGAE